MNRSLESVRSEFLALRQSDGANSLVYLDSAASTLKAKSVVDREAKFLNYEAANVHRGSYTLSDNATTLYEDARETVKNFIGAKDSAEIIFTRNTTEGLNLVARCLGQKILKPGDEILVTEMEHHSNIVPWQITASLTGSKVVAAQVTRDGQIDIESFKSLLSKKTKIVALQTVSNALGTRHDLRLLTALAREVGAYIVLDAAQSVSSLKTNVQELDCDFLAFSGHKIFAPFGIGALYGRLELLNELPPFLGGGSMIDRVSFSGTTYLKAPYRFEAGTPNVSGAVALAEALNFVNDLGLEKIYEHEKSLHQRAEEALRKIDKVKIIGANPHRHNVISFLVDGLHPSDVGFFLSKQGLCVRAGHHCCQPLMQALGISGTVRASFSVYTNDEDVERLVESVQKCLEFL